MGPNNPLRAIIIPNDSRRNSINLSVFFCREFITWSHYHRLTLLIFFVLNDYKSNLKLKPWKYSEKVFCGIIEHRHCLEVYPVVVEAAVVVGACVVVVVVVVVVAEIHRSLKLYRISEHFPILAVG